VFRTTVNQLIFQGDKIISGKEKTPRYDVKTSSDYTLGGFGYKEHKTVIRDNATGQTYTGTSSTSGEKSRENAFNKAKKDRS
jgi:hypothetical protein